MKTNDQADRDRLMRWLMIVVALWGGLLSLGALLFGIDDQGTVSFAVQPLRGLIAFSCVVGFLGVWLLTDFWRKVRLKRRELALLAAAEAEKQAAADAETEHGG